MDRRGRSVDRVEFISVMLRTRLIFLPCLCTRLFIIGSFGWLKGDPSHYPKLGWLVDGDLIRLILFKKTPSYTSEEQQPLPDLDNVHPPITGYRLLVSGNVLISGMVKAYCSYADFGVAANALDWSFGVFVASA